MEKNHSQTLDVNKIKQKTFGGAVAFFERTLILNAIGFAANIILAGQLGVVDFAVYGVVTQIIGVLTFFSDIGLASSLIQRQEKPQEKDYQSVFWVQFGLAGLIVACCFTIIYSGVFYQQLGNEGGAILLALAFSFLIGTLKTVPSIKLTRELSFSKFVIPQVLEQVVFNGLLIYLVLQNYGLRAYTIAIWGRTLVGTAAMLYLVPFIPRLVFSYTSVCRFLKYGLKFQLNDLLARFKDQFFYLFLASRMSAHEFGLISFAKNWSMYPYNLTVQNVMSLTFPTFSRLQKHQQYLRRAIEKSLYFITLIIFPLLTGMCLFFYPLTQVISKYQKWESALFSFICFTLSIAPAAISSPLTNVLNAVGKINQTLKLMVMWTLLTWLLTLPLLKLMGFDAVALAALLISTTSIITVVLVKKVVNFSLWSQIAMPTLGSLAMVVVTLPLMSVWLHSLSVTLLGGLLSMVVYLVVVLFFGRQQLFREIRSLLNKGQS